MNFQRLYKKASNGNVSTWLIKVESEDTALITIEHGYVGGAQQTEYIDVIEGKNIGRANETTAVEQARLEAAARWKKQKEKGYTEDPSGCAEMEVYLPMLAQKYSERSKYIKFPCYVQPKFNGMRCISYIKNGARVYQSRLGKFWTTLGHLNEALKPFDGLILDGEIYLHGVDLQNIASLVKSQKDNIVEGLKVCNLEYWVYDIIQDAPFKERHETLCRQFPNGVSSDGYVFNAITSLCLRAEDLAEFHGINIDEGYEGTMLRNMDGMYALNKRSNDLQKFKNTLSDEFEIVGGYMVKTGREQGTCIFTCKTKGGMTFDVRPKGTLEKRRKYWEALNSLVGKMLTCNFQEWTSDGKPFHARGVAIRDYE